MSGPSAAMDHTAALTITAVRSSHPATADIIDRHPHLVIRLRAGDPTALRQLRMAGLPGDVTADDVLSHANATALQRH